MEMQLQFKNFISSVLLLFVTKDFSGTKFHSGTKLEKVLKEPSDKERIQLQRTSGRLIKRQHYNNIRNCVGMMMRNFEIQLDRNESDAIKNLEQIFCLRGDRTLTWFANVLSKRSCSEKIFLANGGVIANDSYRQKWDTNATWRSFIVEDDMCPQNIKTVTSRAYLFKCPVPKTVCKICNLSYSDLSHVFFDCEQSIQFWNDWSNDSKFTDKSSKDAMKDKSRLVEKLLIPPGDEKIINKLTYNEFEDRDYVLRRLKMGKSYLYCCSLVGRKPVYCEFNVNIKSLQYTKKSNKCMDPNSWEFTNKWMARSCPACPLDGCPRPPSKGLFP